MTHSSPPPTTHTLEMEQVADLNARLTGRTGASAVTAARVGMGGALLQHHTDVRLPDDAVLVRLSWQGSPEFPDIYGHFGPGRRGSVSALLHTDALDQLARCLGLRQRWGIGLPPAKQHERRPPGAGR